MKFLVTGGIGFIGTNLVKKLIKLEHEVVAIDNFDPYYSEQIKKVKYCLASL